MPSTKSVGEEEEEEEEGEEGEDDDGEDDKVDPLASRSFCASTSFSRNVFCRLLNVSYLSGSISASDGVDDGLSWCERGTVVLMARAAVRDAEAPTAARVIRRDSMMTALKRDRERI